MCRRCVVDSVRLEVSRHVEASIEQLSTVQYTKLKKKAKKKHKPLSLAHNFDLIEKLHPKNPSRELNRRSLDHPEKEEQTSFPG